MTEEALKDLVDKIVATKCETRTIELKAAAGGCPKKLYDSLSSFSNQNEGGVIVFGINEEDNFNVCGVYDAHDLQTHVQEQCKQMQPVLRPVFTSCMYDGKMIVSCELAGANINDRPVYYKAAGRLKGSYTRVGNADELMSDAEIYDYETYRENIQTDMRTIDEFQVKWWDKKRYADFLAAFKNDQVVVNDDLTDKEILEIANAVKDDKLTLTGLLLFSTYPQVYFYNLCILATCYSGTDRSEDENGTRFIDKKRITGSICDMRDLAEAFVIRNMKTRVEFDSEGKRHDIPEYPIVAIREAITNALIHRDYSQFNESVPVRIEMFSDRIEISNPGGLYAGVDIDKPIIRNRAVRNPDIVGIMELLKYTEDRFTGIITMRRKLKEAHMEPPQFYSGSGYFTVIIRNAVNATGTSDNVRPVIQAPVRSSYKGDDSLLEYCKTPRTRDELTEFVGQSRNHVMAYIVKPLVASGRLKLTIPSKPGSSKQKFYSE